MSTPPTKTDSYIDHEAAVARHYRWWGVFLIREKRRLQAIADAVALADQDPHSVPGAAPALADQADEAVVSQSLPDAQGNPAPDDLLIQVDAELAIRDALAELETDERPEPALTGDQSSDEEHLRRKLRGRAALLGAQRDDHADDVDGEAEV